MKITAKIKLQPNSDQHAALLTTLETANAACNYISQVAWDNRTFRQFDLHHFVYYDARERFGLSADMTIRCIAKVAHAYKADQKTKRTFKATGGFPYNPRTLRYVIEGGFVTIWSIVGRLKISFVAGNRQLEQLKTQKGESELLFTNGQFYLAATCDTDEPDPIEPTDVLGVDLGIKNIATTSDGQKFAGNHLNNIRRRRRRQRKNIQPVGTKSSKRKLKRLSGKERRFATHINHCISKQIVNTAKDTNSAIALEDLKGIRNRIRLRRSQRDDLHSWAFFQLGEFIKYKAKLAGVPVVFVNPRYTSQACHKCGSIDKGNRKTQDKFLCLSCGHADHADINAALNISVLGRAVVNLPIDSSWSEATLLALTA